MDSGIVVGMRVRHMFLLLVVSDAKFIATEYLISGLGEAASVFGRVCYLIMRRDGRFVEGGEEVVVCIFEGGRGVGRVRKGGGGESS